MNITVNIKAPELVSAIQALAGALAGRESFQFAPQNAVVPQAPTHQAPVQQVPTQAPGADPAQHQSQTSAVPTTEQSYTIDQLAVAATQLMDAGRQQELMQLLNNFGVQALTMLPKEQYGAFATQLRAMGAKL